MNSPSRLMFAALGLLLGSALAIAQSPRHQTGQGQLLEQNFEAAAAAYDSGHFANATTLLEKLEVEVPQSFKVHELLGLTYAAQSNDKKAVAQMQIAVRLQPNTMAARTNLAACLMRVGRTSQAKAEFQHVLELDPQSYIANHDLAGIYLGENNLAKALPLLQAAQQIQPNAADNGYNLALTYLLTGNLEDAHELVVNLAKQKDSGELHNLLGRIDEQEGVFVDAANEFATAARMDPSEDNLFIWASELLLHHTYVPAIDVFTEATSRYPKSPRLLIGLGMALYARGEYEQSIHSLLLAADLNPRDARCYLFLSRAYLSSPKQAEDVIERFRRYTELEPSNSLALEYYALSLWKGRRLESHDVDYHTVQTLLQRSIALDRNLADAHLQLGILYTDLHEYAKSLPEYQIALQLNPNLADAHFRMGRYYLHTGEKEKAQREFDVFKKLQGEHLAEQDKAEVQQFIVSSGTASPPQP